MNKGKEGKEKKKKKKKKYIYIARQRKSREGASWLEHKVVTCRKGKRGNKMAPFSFMKAERAGRWHPPASVPGEYSSRPLFLRLML